MAQAFSPSSATTEIIVSQILSQSALYKSHSKLRFTESSLEIDRNLFCVLVFDRPLRSNRARIRGSTCDLWPLKKTLKSHTVSRYGSYVDIWTF